MVLLQYVVHILSHLGDIMRLLSYLDTPIHIPNEAAREAFLRDIDSQMPSIYINSSYRGYLATTSYDTFIIRYNRSMDNYNIGFDHLSWFISNTYCVYAPYVVYQHTSSLYRRSHDSIQSS